MTEQFTINTAPYKAAENFTVRHSLGITPTELVEYRNPEVIHLSKHYQRTFIRESSKDLN